MAQAAGKHSLTRLGRYIWAGTHDGKLYEVDTKSWKRATTRIDIHVYGIIGIFRLPDVTYTLDSSGRLVVWLPDLGELPNSHLAPN